MISISTRKPRTGVEDFWNKELKWLSGDRGKWSRVIEETNVQLDYHPAREREERESEREKEEEIH